MSWQGQAIQFVGEGQARLFDYTAPVQLENLDFTTRNERQEQQLLVN